MAVDARTKQILWVKSGGICAFPGCRQYLLKDAADRDSPVTLGEIAHIVAQGPAGPRRSSSWQPAHLDAYENLILLCHKCHEVVDGQPQTYPVEKLLQFKRDHEEWVRVTLSPRERNSGLKETGTLIEERISAALMAVAEIPHFVFSAPCELLEEDAKGAITTPEDSRLMLPFIIRGDRLYSFTDLRDLSSPFAKVVDPYSAEAHNSVAWWDDQDKGRWFVELLNRTLNKITGRKGLHLDKEHRRYYFAPDVYGQAKEVRYKTITGRQSSRNVVWNPKFKHSGESKPHWIHLAAALRFHRLGERSWALSIRPEHRFTKDGVVSLHPKTVGRRSTKRKSKMYNIDVLEDVQFWRDFLSDSGPRIICRFGGGQNLVVDNKLISTTVNWPSVEEDPGNRIQVTYEDDLFSRADLEELDKFSEFEEGADVFDHEESEDADDEEDST